MNKKVFSVEVNDGVKVELAILKPTAKVRINAQLIYNKSWAEAEKNGSPLARNLDEVAERHGIWNEEKTKQVESLGHEIVSLEKTLRGGANNFSSKEEAKTCALKIRELRSERFRLLRSRDDLYVYTAENFADNARMNYFISQSTVNNDNGKCFFKSYEDFLEQAEGPVAREATKAYIELMSEDVKDDSLDLYEVQWLMKYDYADSKGRLTNDDGKLVSNDGKLINEDYHYVDNEGSRVDVDGTPLDDSGEYAIHYREFN